MLPLRWDNCSTINIVFLKQSKLLLKMTNGTVKESNRMDDRCMSIFPYHTSLGKPKMLVSSIQ